MSRLRSSRPRTYAFFESKVLNALMVVIGLSLIMCRYASDLLLPAVCGSVAMVLAVGYTVWFVVSKPRSIVINRWLSNVSGWLVIYMLCVFAMEGASVWWDLFPMLCSVVLLFVMMLKNHDENFEIKHPDSELI